MLRHAGAEHRPQILISLPPECLRLHQRQVKPVVPCRAVETDQRRKGGPVRARHHDLPAVKQASSWPGSWPETAVGEAVTGAGDEAVGE